MHFGKKDLVNAFTLVEMIVVITILAILATIGLIGYASYLPKVRDSARISTMQELVTGMESYKVKSTLPVPDDSLEIKGSGSLIAYQGFLGKNVLKSISFNKDGRDPETEQYYDYYLSKNGKYFQLMTFLEKQNIDDVIDEVSLQNYTYAADEIDYQAKFLKVFGNNLGILTTDILEPVNRVVPLHTQGYLDLAFDTEEYIAHFENDRIERGNKRLAGILKTLSLSSNFGEPKECMKGFIPVPGNKQLNQPGFCVAKYEMTFANGNGIPDDSAWNVYDYDDNKYITSKIDYPITSLTIKEASLACKKIGTHLITNLEWMTIAHNITYQKQNWSGGDVDNGNMYNGNSSNSSYGTSNNAGPNSFATKTGGKDNINLSSIRSGDDRRQNILSNNEIIWDFAGNVEEFVNKTNDIDNITGLNNVLDDLVSDTSWILWNDEKVLNNVREKHGPNTELNNVQSLGKVYESSDSWERIFIRGGAYGQSFNVGVFTLNHLRTPSYISSSTGFRCAY